MMKRTALAVVAACAVAGAGIALASRRLSAQDVPPTRPGSDLTVTVRHLNGDVETYASELTNLDLVVDEGGQIRFVHCVLVLGEERDTHVWYNFANLAAIKYRFHTITGKAKVAIKQLKGLPVQPKPGLPRKIDLLDVEDYK